MKTTIDWHVGPFSCKWTAHAPGGWIVCEGEEPTRGIDRLENVDEIKHRAEEGVRGAYETHPLGNAPAENLLFVHTGLPDA